MCVATFDALVLNIKKSPLTSPLATTYEFIVPSQPPTGVLSINLHGTRRLKVPEPCEESCYSPREADSNPWLPYTIIEYEQFHISAEYEFYGYGLLSWAKPREGSFKFEVADRSSELAVRIFVRRFDARGALEIVPLGFIKVNPITESEDGDGEDAKRIPVQGGTGRECVIIKTSYLEKTVPPLHDTEVWRVHGEMGSSDLVYVQKTDTNRSYGMNTVPITTDIAPSSELVHRIEHPYIAPLKFAFKSAKGLSLLSPLGSGGPLYHHLQRTRRFSVDQARFYAAELLCALEYLHDKHIILAHLNMEDLFLDSPGHLSLCKPSLFSQESQDSDIVVPGISAYPAPESVNSQNVSRAADWWAFGIILYEMLTGLPPFHDQDVDKRQLKMRHDQVHFEGLPPTAKDILIKLLEKDPLSRLGGKNGAPEIKNHPFFQDTNWHDLLQRTYTTPFKPHDAKTDFWPGANEYDSDRGRKVEEKIENGKAYRRVVDAPWPRCEWKQTGWVKDGSAEDDSDGPSSPTREDFDDGWTLSWDPTSYRFTFHNRFTGESSPGRLSERRIESEPAAFAPTASSPSCETPPLSERKAALATALVAGYGVHVFAQILQYGSDWDLSTPILTYKQPHNPRIPFDEVEVIPLEWAVEHNRLDLVRLFLAHGADPNVTVEPREGPALVKAVRRRNKKLVEVLAQKTDRVSGTRALQLAVEKQYSDIVDILLANGVQCNFEESDRPLPDRPCMSGYKDPHETIQLEAEHFAPPLLLAARSGNADLLKTLLAHGADPDTPYHGIPGFRPESDGSGLKVQASFTCGRVIQSAMEYGQSEIVHILLDAGADINLPRPVWPVPVWPIGGHVCEPVPRAVYLEVTAGLEAAIALRGEAR